MLKIKDNVDLKELENKKYGFRKVKLGNEDEILYKSKKGEKDVIEIEVDLNTRNIKLSQMHDYFNTQEDTLYDLIQANMVEKV